MTEDPGPIAYARHALKDILAQAQAWPVITNIPPQLIPPCVVLTEGNPFVAQGDTAGGVRVTFKALLISQPSDNEAIISLLDEETDTVITHLTAEGVPFSVDGYEAINAADGQTYLAAALTIPLDLTL